MASRDSAPPKLDVGRVIGGTFSALARNWWRIAALAIPLGFAPYVASYWIVSHLPFAALSAWRPIIGYLAEAWVSFAVGVVPGSVLAAYVCRWVAADAEGGRKTFALNNLDHLLVLVSARLMAGVGVNLAALLLYLPAILLSQVWAVIGPVAVLEGAGPVASLRRSADLTRRRLWRLVMVWIVFFLIYLTASFCIAVPYSLMVRGMLGAELRIKATFALVAGLSALLYTVYAVLWYVAAPVIYFELIQLKSGLGGRNPAAVFD